MATGIKATGSGSRDRKPAKEKEAAKKAIPFSTEAPGEMAVSEAKQGGIAQVQESVHTAALVTEAGAIAAGIMNTELSGITAEALITKYAPTGDAEAAQKIQLYKGIQNTIAIKSEETKTVTAHFKYMGDKLDTATEMLRTAGKVEDALNMENRTQFKKEQRPIDAAIRANVIRRKRAQVVISGNEANKKEAQAAQILANNARVPVKVETSTATDPDVGEFVS